MAAGYTVLVPVGDNQRYDFLIENETGFDRVQAKTGRLSNDRIVFPTNSVRLNTKGFTRKNYFGEAEFFSVYCPELDKVYKVPVDSCGKRAKTLFTEEAVSLRKDTLASDYEVKPLPYS